MPYTGRLSYLFRQVAVEHLHGRRRVAAVSRKATVAYVIHPTTTDCTLRAVWVDTIGPGYRSAGTSLSLSHVIAYAIDNLLTAYTDNMCVHFDE